MQQLVVIGDRRLRVGDKLRSNSNAYDNGICDSNIMVTVRALKKDGEILIGLCSDQRIDGWGNLDGRVSSRTGYWASRDCVMDNFDCLTNDHEVVGDYMFKNTNLRGMACVLIHHDRRTNQCFVELDDDVGGGSADGMGKKGHCVVLPATKLHKKSIKASKEAAKGTPPSDEQIQEWIKVAKLGG